MDFHGLDYGGACVIQRRSGKIVIRWKKAELIEANCELEALPAVQSLEFRDRGRWQRVIAKLSQDLVERVE